MNSAPTLTVAVGSGIAAAVAFAALVAVLILCRDTRARRRRTSRVTTASKSHGQLRSHHPTSNIADAVAVDTSMLEHIIQHDPSIRHSAAFRRYPDSQALQIVSPLPHQATPGILISLQAEDRSFVEAEDGSEELLGLDSDTWRKYDDAVGSLHEVIKQYTQLILDDELLLHVGDRVVLNHIFEDGWGRGKNLSTNRSGVFPILCIDYDPNRSLNRGPQRDVDSVSTQPPCATTKAAVTTDTNSPQRSSSLARTGTGRRARATTDAVLALSESAIARAELNAQSLSEIVTAVARDIRELDERLRRGGLSLRKYASEREEIIRRAGGVLDSSGIFDI